MGRKLAPIWGRPEEPFFIRSAVKHDTSHYWATCVRCGAGMSGRVPLLTRHLYQCELVPEEWVEWVRNQSQTESGLTTTATTSARTQGTKRPRRDPRQELATMQTERSGMASSTNTSGLARDVILSQELRSAISLNGLLTPPSSVRGSSMPSEASASSQGVKRRRVCSSKQERTLTEILGRESIVVDFTSSQTISSILTEGLKTFAHSQVPSPSPSTEVERNDFRGDRPCARPHANTVPAANVADSDVFDESPSDSGDDEDTGSEKSDDSKSGIGHFNEAWDSIIARSRRLRRRKRLGSTLSSESSGPTGSLYSSSSSSSESSIATHTTSTASPPDRMPEKGALSDLRDAVEELPPIPPPQDARLEAYLGYGIEQNRFIMKLRHTISASLHRLEAI